MREPTIAYSVRRRFGDRATLALAAALLASGAVLLALQSELTFRLDDWALLLYRRFGGVDELLAPHNEHIVLAPVLAYKALLALFGADSAAPFQVVSTSTFLAAAACLFVYLRRRVGAWLALAGLLPVLFLGTSAENLLWQFQLGFLGTIAAGLGALLALERDDRRGDMLACALLVVAVAFSSLWLPFAVAATVIVGSDRRRRRRLYVVVIPAALYAAWWLGWGNDAPSAFAIGQLPHVPLYVLEGLSSSVAAWTGIAQAQDDLTVNNTLVGGIVLAGAVGFAIWRARGVGGVSPWLVAVCAGALAFWVAAGANATLPGRAAEASRYQLVGVVFALLIVAEAIRGIRPGPRSIAVVAAVALAATASNVASLIRVADGFERGTQVERADLAALEIARTSVAPGFELDQQVAETSLTSGVRAELYFPFIDEYGSPALTAAELADATGPARATADRVLASALGLAVGSATRARPRAGGPPELLGHQGAVARTRGPCVAFHPAPGSASTVRVPTGGALVRAGPAPITELGLRRFATGSAPIDAGDVAAGQIASIPIPRDASSRPWVLRVRSRSRAEVCGLR